MKSVVESHSFTKAAEAVTVTATVAPEMLTSNTRWGEGLTLMINISSFLELRDGEEYCRLQSRDFGGFLPAYKIIFTVNSYMTNNLLFVVIFF